MFFSFRKDSFELFRVFINDKYMRPTSTNQEIQTLLDSLHAAFSSEKVLSFYFTKLMTLAKDVITLQAIAQEAAENNNHCQRLEALIDVVHPMLSKSLSDDQKANYINHARTIFRRISMKHQLAGYQVSIMAAYSAGRGDIADELEKSIGKRKLEVAC